MNGSISLKRDGVLSKVNSTGVIKLVSLSFRKFISSNKFKIKTRIKKIKLTNSSFLVNFDKRCFFQELLWYRNQCRPYSGGHLSD